MASVLEVAPTSTQLEASPPVREVPLVTAEITLDEASEDLSHAKLDQEDAHERQELAREQAQSTDAKVVYLPTQVEQIQESVREVKGSVLEATRKVEDILALPTLSEAEDENFLSLRAAFAESQQELARTFDLICFVAFLLI
ncbi:hypothetical protein H6P81_013376 [Aristolochia fimbriata]|uniref:Uncharacterized protein n=1 Tax=Aristolochia fimbriata TaxID=158543 RepID=A0AAV7EEI8_ARIFI|nr:hypothetical protein H6P81_013376 [Aristolochia fimbriata]